MTDKITDKNTLKNWFLRGMKPLASQFAAWMDSYWHKSETIPIKNIESLENTLNNKAEAASVNNLTKLFVEHKQDDLEHKTIVDSGKLNNLADNPNETYATKEEIRKNIPIVITATLRPGDRILYEIDEKDVSVLHDCVETEDYPIVKLVFVDSQDEITLLCTRKIKQTMRGNTKYSLDFFEYTEYSANRVNIRDYCWYDIKFGDTWAGNNIIECYDASISDSEYKADRYLPRGEAFDMNDFGESGGFSVNSSVAGFGANIPPGFKDFSGFVLNTGMTCTQVAVDNILKKQFIRSAIFLSGRKWTEWKEIGSADCLKASNIYIVSEYPTDLSDYPEGSIFIKQS